MSLKRAESFSGIAFVPIVALMIWVVAVTVTPTRNENLPRSTHHIAKRIPAEERLTARA